MEQTITIYDIEADLEKRFNARVGENDEHDRPHTRDDLLFITVPKSDAVAAVTHLKENRKFTHLVFFTAVDIIERGFFRLSYMLHSYAHRMDVCIQTEIPRDEPVADSIHYLWAGAKVYERELREMYGIEFPGCPRVEEPFALEGWNELPPMRRDFDTKEYSERTFFARPGRRKYDKERSMKEKLYPEVDL